jgi:hypothetical protein
VRLREPTPGTPRDDEGVEDIIGSDARQLTRGLTINVREHRPQRDEALGSTLRPPLVMSHRCSCQHREADLGVDFYQSALEFWREQAVHLPDLGEDRECLLGKPFPGNRRAHRDRLDIARRVKNTSDGRGEYRASARADQSPGLDVTPSGIASGEADWNIDADRRQFAIDDAIDDRPDLGHHLDAAARMTGRWRGDQNPPAGTTIKTSDKRVDEVLPKIRCPTT